MCCRFSMMAPLHASLGSHCHLMSCLLAASLPCDTGSWKRAQHCPKLQTRKYQSRDSHQIFSQASAVEVWGLWHHDCIAPCGLCTWPPISLYSPALAPFWQGQPQRPGGKAQFSYLLACSVLPSSPRPQSHAWPWRDCTTCEISASFHPLVPFPIP